MNDDEITSYLEKDINFQFIGFYIKGNIVNLKNDLELGLFKKDKMIQFMVSNGEFFF